MAVHEAGFTLEYQRALRGPSDKFKATKPTEASGPTGALGAWAKIQVLALDAAWFPVVSDAQT